MSLCDSLECHSLSPPYHPFAISEQGDKAEGDKENDTEDQDNAGLAVSPIAPLCDEPQPAFLASLDGPDGWHLDRRL